MNDQNNNSNLSATVLKTTEIKTGKQVIRIKASKSAAGKTSARPTRSFLKAKSITKPLLNQKKVAPVK